eukprot:PhF_6_TR44489/c3_g1_i3/m.68513
MTCSTLYPPATTRLWLCGTYTFKGHTSCVKSVAISTDSKYIVSGSEDKTVRVWELTHPSTSSSIVLSAHTDYVNCVCISNDSIYIVSGSDDTTVLVWNLVTRHVVLSLTGHIEGVKSVAISSDAQFIVSGGDRTIRVWRHDGTSVILGGRNPVSFPFRDVQGTVVVENATTLTRYLFLSSHQTNNNSQQSIVVTSVRQISQRM